jgi:CRISPR-associated protein Cas5t
MDKLIHATIRGITATFRIPLVVSGKSLCAPVPSYSTLLGFLGCCAGKEVYPDDVRIGFEYRFGEDVSGAGLGVDMETTHRFEFRNNKLRPHLKGTSIRSYEFHTYPVLEIYLDNMDFFDILKRPAGIPTFGRSQDLTWIEKVEMTDVTQKTTGKVGTTLMPFPQENIGGRMLRLPEFFDNRITGMTRNPVNIRLFQVVSAGSLVVNPNLYHINNDTDEEHAIYLHKWAGIDGKE